MRAVRKRIALVNGVCLGLALGGTIAPAFGQPVQGVRGLDALPEDRVYAELAGRGLNSLLERDFELGKATPEQREAVKAMGAMRDLGSVARLSPKEREEQIAAVVRGAQRSLENERDPMALVSSAEQLIELAVFRDINTLEYWGDSAQTMARLKPVAEAVGKMLGRAAELARKQADEAANKIAGPNDQAGMDRYNKLDATAVKAEYTQRMNDYAVVVSLDPADPNRAKIADSAIEYLKQFDNAESTVQATVRLQTGKLLLAKGAYDDATKVLDEVWAGKDKIQPAPAAGQEYEARYFAAVAQMKAGKLDEAQKRLSDLLPWQKELLKSSLQASSGADAAGLMLQYRIHVAQKDDAKAQEDLIALVKARPDLESTVLDQLGARISDSADLKTLDLLPLRSVFARGELERKKPEGQPVDAKVLARAVEAGKELMSRRGKVGVDSGLIEDTAIKLPLLLEREGKNVEAARAALDFIAAFGPNHKNSGGALDKAMYLVANLRQANPEDVEVGKLYDRLLALAVEPPFSQMDLAYDWARRLQGAGKYAEAVKYFEKVPAEDPRAPMARFFRVVALKQVLDQDVSLPAADRARRSGEVRKLVDQVTAEAKQRMTSGGASADQLKNDKLIVASTALIGADVALREDKDPKRAIKLLDGFELATAGLASEQRLLSQAMTVRVFAKMEVGENEEAAKILTDLLEKTGGAEGADLVFRLLSRLDSDFDKAKAAGDEAAMRSLARARAGLSGRLVAWAEGNADPKVKAQTYRYRVYDADTKRNAANLETDETARAKGREAALKLYESLKQDPNADANVDFGLAMVAYDLERYDQARAALALLLEQRKLGPAMIEEDRNGQTATVPNDRYWEANLKLMRATLKMVEQGKADAAAKQGIVDGLKQLYARWGKGMGGAKWAGEFEKLRSEIAPDYAAPELGG